MIWTKYIIKTTAKDEDIVSAILAKYDITDIQIENNISLTDEELNAMYADLDFELPAGDGSSTIDFYIEFDENGTNRLKTETMLDDLQKDLKAAEELFGIEPVSLESLEVDSDDWENNWKAYFKPFTVGDILIRPSWEEAPEGADARAQILIDPGMAFGTGSHETTRLCIKAISENIKEGDVFTDLGCGSGILGIAAIKLGASHAAEVDIDTGAVKIAKENFDINEIPEDKVTFITGDLVGNEEVRAQAAESRADLICANILAEVLKMMMPGLSDYLKDGGLLILSGIIREKEELIKEAIAENPELEYIRTEYDGEWAAVYVKKV